MKKTIALLLAVLMLLPILASCSDSSTEPTVSASPSDAASNTQNDQAPPAGDQGPPPDGGAQPDEQAPTEADVAAPGQDPFDTLNNTSLVMDLPISDTPVSLSLMMTGLISDMMTGVLDTYADHIQFKKAEELTGVHIDFNELSQQTWSEKFNLMVISEEYPDMILNAVQAFVGGSAQAIEDDFLIRLNELAAEYAPLYMEVVNANETLKRANVNDNGDMPQFFAIMNEYVPNDGPGARADWLEALGMDAPETYQEYHDYLLAAKNEYDPEYPLLVSGYANDYAMAMGTPGFDGQSASHLFQKDGVVTSSFREQGYKDYVEMMHQWYTEGLLNENFYSVSGQMGMNEQIMFSGEAAMWSASVVHLKRMVNESGIEGVAVVGLRDPVNTPGEVHHFGGEQTLVDNTKLSITTACENPEIACKWINFWFTQEGRMMASYGTLGVSYEFNDEGVPYYTDNVINNPNGWIYAQCTTYYCVYNHVITLFDRRKNWSTYGDYQVDALLTWRDSGDGAWHLPGTISLTADEGSETSTIMTDISTYASENIIRFITGETPMSEWDAQMAQIESMGLGRIIEVYQDALDRYNKRLA